MRWGVRDDPNRLAGRGVGTGMHPIAHSTIACAAAKVCEPALRRVGGPGAGIDYRFAAAGAVLPDAIDKPLAWVLLPGTFDDSHLIGHTLLFSLSLILVGLVLARRGEMRLLLLGIGALMHLPVDPVLRNPSTLLWPLLGTEFDYAKPPVPYSIVVDAGLLVVFGFAARKPRWRARMWRFLTRGELSWDEENRGARGVAAAREA